MSPDQARFALARDGVAARIGTVVADVAGYRVSRAVCEETSIGARIETRWAARQSSGRALFPVSESLCDDAVEGLAGIRQPAPLGPVFG